MSRHPLHLALLVPWAAQGQMPALERFHDVLPAQDFVALIPGAAADMDQDGDVDVVAGAPPFSAHPRLQTSLWLNDGDAVFAEAPGAFPPGLYPAFDLTVADLDGDGLPEVFEGRYPEADRLFQNLGGGAFADASSSLPSYGPMSGPSAGRVLDHDLDGDLDLFRTGAQNHLFENLGALAFQDASAALPASAAYWGYASVAGDLDADADPDLVVLTYGGSTARVLLNQAGAFALAGTIAPSVTTISPRNAVLADLDGDQDLDAVFGGQPLLLGENDGAGALTPSSPFPPLAFVAVSLAAGDVDGDHDQDLVVSTAEVLASGITHGSAHLLRNGGALAFASLPFPSAEEAVEVVEYHLGLLADLDGDQDLDYLRNGSRAVLGDGRGNFDSSDDGLLVSYDAVAADLEGDGDVELFQSYPLRYQPTGVTGLEPAVLLPFEGVYLAAGDVDSDGDADLLAGHGDSEEWLNPVPALYLGDGSGGFSDGSAGLPGVPWGDSVHLADVDGDGNLDGLLQGYPGKSLILGRGDGTFRDASGRLRSAEDFDGPELADLDADGDLDLVYASSSAITFSSTSFSGRARLLRNDAAQGFTDVTLGQLDQATAVAVAVGDVDVDGDFDLAFVGLGQDGLQENDGLGSFTDVTASALPSEDHLGINAAFFDPDADGDLDLFVGGGQEYVGLGLDGFIGVFKDGRSVVLANDGAGVFAEADVLPEGLLMAYVEPVAADFDRDGDVDLHLSDSLGLLANTTRHLAWTKPPRLGRALELALRGDAGTPWVLLAAAKTVDINLGDLGILGVDPAHPVILTAGMFHGSRADEATFRVPSDPALAGESLYWQALVGAPSRLTNVERTTFTSF